MLLNQSGVLLLGSFRTDEDNGMAVEEFTGPFSFFQRIRAQQERDEEQIKTNQFLEQALTTEKHEGHRVAVIARTVALGVVALFLPTLNPNWNVLYYEFLILVFIALGWLQLRMASVGQSRVELGLIFLDLVLMTLVCVLPNPFLDEQIPNAMVYRFDTFIYFFVLLAAGTLAYSWRTVMAMGTWVAGLWLLSMLGVVFLGHQIPDLSAAAAAAFTGHELVSAELDPNSVQPSVRVQEMIVFVLVAGILAAKGWRSNRLLIQQADIAAERANLSRYFPTSLVDVLASTHHDIGAVRSQDVAVLFTDIVGFTKFAEENSPDDVMSLLRGYHALVERAVFQNGGTLDKYLGDGAMATFGTPQTGPDDAVNALQAARQIVDEVGAVNAEREKRGESPVKVSIGVHFGSVILGDIGPSRRLEFAVVGDTVNVASRLEAATRELGCQCVVSNELMDRCRSNDKNTAAKVDSFEPRSAIKLRGRSMPIDVWVM